MLSVIYQRFLSFVILQTYVAFLKEDTDKNVVNKTRAEPKQVMRQPGNEMGSSCVLNIFRAIRVYIYTLYNWTDHVVVTK